MYRARYLFAYLSMIGFVVAGCSSASNEGLTAQLYGRWKPNVEKSQEAIAKGGTIMNAQTQAMFHQLMRDMVIEFGPGGEMDMTISVNGEVQTDHARCVVDQVDEATGTLHITLSRTGQPNNKGSIVFTNEDEMTLNTESEAPLVLERIK